MKNKTGKRKHVIPGFGLSLGVTVTMLSLITVIPLASIVLSTAKQTFPNFIETITRPRLISAFGVSLFCSFFAAAVNLVMGVILAWVLVRYDFPGRRILDGLIELPFALPTAIAGISLTSLTVNTGWVGGIFAKYGISIAYTRTGIIIALIFVGIPFVARAVQPVLEKLDPLYEEAAGILGAGRVKIFFKIILPELAPGSPDRLRAGFRKGTRRIRQRSFHSGQPAVSHRDRSASDLLPASGIQLCGSDGDSACNARHCICYPLYNEPYSGACRKTYGRMKSEK
jgi:sulfate transport system permease protein